MENSRRKFLKVGGLTTFAGISGLAFTSCSKNGVEDIDQNNGLNISEVSIPSNIDVVEGGAVVISGKGFKIGDIFKFVSISDASITFTSDASAVSDKDVSFILPTTFTTGNYKITVTRGTDSLALGSTLFNLIADTDIPDIGGMTVKGVVFSDGEGIPGVVVSDGYEVAVTDDKGIYYLPSLKKTGFVFISIPGNYEATTVGNIPQFFKRLSNSVSTVEQKDFSLIKVNNEKHVVIPMADWHLANRNNDIDQYTGKVLPDVNASIDKYSADGTKVYVLTLGDMTWDAYWYNNNFALKEYVQYMNMLKSPVFNLIGNHDYDPYFANDWEAENEYREVLGPTYYSFNLGKIHYVVLDNVEYINTGGSPGTVGSRNYNYNIDSEQIKWLKKDLAAITDKSTPVIVAMHVPLYSKPTLDSNGNQLTSVNLSNGSSLIDTLRDFSTVHVLTGHAHVNYRVEEEPNLMEHNTGAICATWWWTGRSGYANNHICKDGSPGGYSIWKMNGKNLDWRYKGIGHPEDYQFRTYDINSIHITAANFAPKSNDVDLAPYVESYGQQNMNNEVLINIWSFEKDWKIEVEENGIQLSIVRISAKDPLHIISYEALRLNVGAVPTEAFVTNKTPHIFKVIASAPNTTLEIKVTDRFGNVYRESMVRPKAFTYDMV